MSTLTLRYWILAALLLLGELDPALAQTNTPSTNAPAATAPAPIALASVVTSAQDALTTLQNDQVQISPDTAAAAARDALAGITRDINQRLEIDRLHEQAKPRSVGIGGR